jgi:hypothetical protein|tara:strand:+ start:1007 stop:1174 length:168 start_codon:yes stop_codon:yes gene_type:complete
VDDKTKEMVIAAMGIRDRSAYDPGHSDLDDDQPIRIHAKLSDWRRLDRAIRAVME